MTRARCRVSGAGGEGAWPPETRYPLRVRRPRPRPRRHGTGPLNQAGSAMRVLLIEDHKPLQRALRQGLEEEGFAVDVASDGEEGDFKARSAQYDVIILDLMLPKTDGMTLLQNWRRDGLGSHVLILTARSGIEDQVKGLDLGADDYLTKPFELEVLLARLRALIRRTHAVKSPVLRVHDLEIDTSSRTVRRAG